MHTHTVILRHDGVDRNYPCETYFDAVVLADALAHKYGSVNVELWKGSTRLDA